MGSQNFDHAYRLTWRIINGSRDAQTEKPAEGLGHTDFRARQSLQNYVFSISVSSEQSVSPVDTDQLDHQCE